LVKRFSAKQIKRELKLLCVTVEYHVAFCCEICHTLYERSSAIGGPGRIVEIDESVFAKRKHNVGFKVGQLWVLGGVERNENRHGASQSKFRFELIDSHKRREIWPQILIHVVPGTAIYTEMLRTYCALDTLDKFRYTHKTINHSINFTDPDDHTI
jgi:hypothetical protein